MNDARMDLLTDRDLADRVIAEGDEAAFRCLYRRHTPALNAFLLRILGGQASDAEDVLQDTWLRAVRGLSGFQWNAALRTWLTSIALNRAREVLRGKGRLVFGGEVEPEGFTPTPEPGRRLDLERALHALPDGYRTVLLLHDVEGYTHLEIAERLEIAAGTSKSQLFHARRALRRLLEDPEAPHERHGRAELDA